MPVSKQVNPSFVIKQAACIFCGMVNSGIKVNLAAVLLLAGKENEPLKVALPTTGVI